MNQVSEMIHPSWLIAGSLALALVPIILGTTTSYLKISVALGVLRNGFGAQQVPSNAIVMVLSLVLSLFVMQSTIEETVKKIEGVEPLSQTQVPTFATLSRYAEVFSPWRHFMREHVGERELSVLATLAARHTQVHETQAKENPADNGNGDPEERLSILLPAFVLSELKSGLIIGFVLLVPFLVVDLIVANVLAGLGLYMMSPTIISLPLKLLLFVSIDGWLLISRGIIASYQGG
jgi:type III secretory pathway component EscR